MYDELIAELRQYNNDGTEELRRQAADAIEKLSQIETDLRVCRNELCLKCGQYQTKHLGSCNGCRWGKADV